MTLKKTTALGDITINDSVIARALSLIHISEPTRP